MSESNNNQNNPPSIDELISGEFASADDGFSFDELTADSNDGLSDEAFFAELNNNIASSDDVVANPMTDDDAFFAELNKISANDVVDAQSAPSLDAIGADTHTNVDTSANMTAFDVPTNPLVDMPVAEEARNDILNNEVGATEVVAAAATATVAKKGLFGKKDKPTTSKAAGKGGLFAKKEKAPKEKAPKSPKAAKSGGASANPNLLKYIIAAAIVAIILLVGAWFLSQQGEPEAVAPTPPPTSTQPEAPPAPPVEEPAPVEETEPTAQGEVPLPQAGEMIDADAIINAEVPQDEALVKEEIDRLHDKDAQFKEQAQLIDEQLSMMEDLTKAKEEQIRLLEEQIAQLESQKSQ